MRKVALLRQKAIVTDRIHDEDAAGQPSPERADAPECEIVWSDVTRLWAMFAVQGPGSVELLPPLVDVDLAKALHSFHYKVPVLKAEPGVTAARLRLMDAARSRLAEGLAVLGISAPERM